jgi:hypothetical protein
MCKRAKNFRPRPQILSPPVYIDFLHSYAEIIFKYGCQQSWKTADQILYDNTILISDYAIKVVWR